MHILLLSASYPPMLGGLQIVVQTLAQHLKGQGHQVQVVANRYPRSLPAQEVLGGVFIQRQLFLQPSFAYLKQRRWDLFVAAHYFYPMTLWQLKSCVETLKPKVVNIHFPDGQIPFVLWLRRRFNFRLVVSLHGDEIERWFLDPSMPTGQVRLKDKPKIKTGHPLIKILRQADAVTACSNYLLDLASRIEPAVAGKGVAIHNGIEPARFADKTAYTHPRPYLLAYGRLTRQKGFDLLLEALAQIALEHPAVDLILAGEGEDRELLQRQVERLNLAERVHFFGRATPPEVVSLLNGCLFVAVPSRWEPFGIVALEGLAAGKPVLASRVGGLPEFLAGPGVNNAPSAHSLLVDPTVEGLAGGLARWLPLAERGELGPVSGEDILKRYSWTRAVDAYEAVLTGEKAR